MTYYKKDHYDNNFIFLYKRLRGMTHPACIEIIKILETHESLKVSEIQAKLFISQSETSIYLSRLRRLGILNRKTVGKTRIYSNNTELISALISAADKLQ